MSYQPDAPLYSREVQGSDTNGESLRSMFVMHQPVDLDCSKDGRTRQEYADDCDINVLLARYEKTGVFNHFNAYEPNYLDVSDVPDLQRSLEIISRAQAAFMTLPAATRREFDNDPVKFVTFAQDPANIDRMREWKLAEPLPEPPAPIKVEVTNPSVPAS